MHIHWKVINDFSCCCTYRKIQRLYIYIHDIFIKKVFPLCFVYILSLIIFDISITYFFHIARGFNSTYIAKGFFFFNIFQMKKLRLQELVSKSLSLSKDSAALHYYICSMPSSLSVDDMKNWSNHLSNWERMSTDSTTTSAGFSASVLKNSPSLLLSQMNYPWAYLKQIPQLRHLIPSLLEVPSMLF